MLAKIRLKKPAPMSCIMNITKAIEPPESDSLYKFIIAAVCSSFIPHYCRKTGSIWLIMV